MELVETFLYRRPGSTPLQIDPPSHDSSSLSHPSRVLKFFFFKIANFLNAPPLPTDLNLGHVNLDWKQSSTAGLKPWVKTPTGMRHEETWGGGTKISFLSNFFLSGYYQKCITIFY